jgi:hypothetical protein
MSMQAAAMSSLIFQLSGGQMTVEFRKQLLGVSVILVICHVVFLVKLRVFSRWFSVVFFCLQALYMTVNSAVLVVKGDSRHAGVALVVCFLNGLSVWYLSRRSFREFAVQYDSEREKAVHSRMMQKAPQDSLRKGL